MKRILVFMCLLFALTTVNAQGNQSNEYVSYNGYGYTRIDNNTVENFVVLTNYTDNVIEVTVKIRELGVEKTFSLEPNTYTYCTIGYNLISTLYDEQPQMVVGIYCDEPDNSFALHYVHRKPQSKKK